MSKYVYGDRTAMGELDRAFDIGRRRVGGTGIEFRQLWPVLTCGGLRIAEALVKAELFSMEDERVPTMLATCSSDAAVKAVSDALNVSAAQLTAHVRRRLITHDVKAFARDAIKRQVQKLYVARNCDDADDLARNLVADGAQAVADSLSDRLLKKSEHPLAAYGRVADFAWALKAPVAGISRLCGKMKPMSDDRIVCVSESREVAETAGGHVSEIDMRAVSALANVKSLPKASIDELLKFMLSLRDFKGYTVKNSSRGVEIYAPRLRDTITGKLTNVREDVNDVWSFVSQLAQLANPEVRVENIKDVTAEKSTIIDVRTEVNYFWHFIICFVVIDFDCF